MGVSIDRIYDMLSWDNPEKIQNKGIAKGKKVKAIYIFILPILPSSSKAVWGNCAKILADKSNEELQLYLTKLFEWLKDMNWPGADIIFERLMTIPSNVLFPAYEYCVSEAKKTDDFSWQLSLECFYKQYALKHNIV